MSEHTLSSFGIHVLTPKHPQIRKLKKMLGAGQLHGTKVWDASFVMMDFFNIDPLPADQKILDIGCGWGPLSFYLQKKQGAKVISVDADGSVQPYLNLHAQFNDTQALFWQAEISKLKVKDLQMADIVVGCDICFWDSLRDDWKKLLKRANKATVKTLYLCDPGRSPFLDLVEWADKRFDTQLWEHAITEPVMSEHYILQVNF
ncbi:MAG: class I SAM-dependent methyltransferase [Reinekea sp.]